MKFLVATDFSENSNKAIEYAASMANVLDAKITLIHAWQVMPVGAGIEEVGMAQNIETMERESKEILQKTVDNFSKKYPVFERTISQQGFPAEVLEEVYKNIKPDLVVAGRKGQGAVSRAIFGSVSSRLVESDMRPLLIIPEDAEINEMKEVLFLSDFYDSDVTNLKILVDFMKPRNAKINVMHFHTSEHEKDIDEEFFKHFEGVIKDRIDYDNFDFKMQDSNDLHDSLEEVIKSRKIQMLCIASMHRTFWQQLVDPSLTKHLLKKVDLPVMIFDAHSDNMEDLF